jgi:hypothetical protein
MTALPALSSVLAANTPPPPMRKARMKSIQKNVSAETRRLQLVEGDESSSLTPSAFREARFTCSLCGTRSIASVHPPDPSTGLPTCEALRLGLRTR